MTTIDLPVHASISQERTSAPAAAADTIRKAMTADQRLGRALLWGTIIGSVLVFAFCGGIALAAGMGVPAAIGIGVFTAIWGGPGFGGMMGATVYFSNHLDEF